MANRTDIRTDEDNDPVIANGDFQVSASDDQHVQHILLANPGSYKRIPALGAGITMAQNGAVNSRSKRIIREALALDGYKAKRLIFSGDQLEIEV
jgi:hypothetical protein